MTHRDNEVRRQSSYNLEKAYVIGRNAQVTICALGSTLTTHNIGLQLAGMLFPGSQLAGLIIANLFVCFGWMAVDFVFLNALTGASEKTENRKHKRRLWAFAGASFIVTLILSFISITFLSPRLSGPSHLNKYNAQVQSMMRQDSTMKMEAFSLIQAAGGEEQQRIAKAEARAKELLDAAVAAGSASWQSDYQAAKNSPKNWFWTCRNCPREYRAYRDGIKDAKEQGDRLKEQAYGYAESVQASLAPTLAYQAQNDTTLSQFNANIIAMENERKAQIKSLNWVLAGLTLGCGALAFVLSGLLASHREEHGQLVKEDPVRPIMILIDFVGRMFDECANVIYSLQYWLMRPFKKYNLVFDYSLRDPQAVLPIEHRTQNAAPPSTQSRRAQNTEFTDTEHRTPTQSGTENAAQSSVQNAESSLPDSLQRNTQQSAPPPTQKNCRTAKCPPKTQKRSTEPPADRTGNQSARTEDRARTPEDIEKFIKRFRGRVTQSVNAKFESTRAKNKQLVADDRAYLESIGYTVSVNGAECEVLKN